MCVCVCVHGSVCVLLILICRFVLGVGGRVVSCLMLRIVICAGYDIFLIAAYLPLKSIILSWGRPCGQCANAPSYTHTYINISQ